MTRFGEHARGERTSARIAAGGREASVFVPLSGHTDEDTKTRERLILPHYVGEENGGARWPS